MGQPLIYMKGGFHLVLDLCNGLVPFAITVEPKVAPQRHFRRRSMAVASDP